jgi:hypothetical protein
MKIKRACALAAVLALAVPATAAIAGNGDKATGGGQVFFDSEDTKASTIAFTAQGTIADAKGQIQVIDRSASTERTKYHGVVDCIEVDGNTAVIGGYRKGTANADRFTLRVVDNGEPNQGADMIALDDESTDFRCGEGDDDDDAPTISLAHGNAQVRDGDSSNPPEGSSMSFRKALKLAGLR